MRTLNFNYKLVTVVASHTVYTFFPFHIGNQNASFIQVLHETNCGETGFIGVP
jgi:hypothetical protein